MNFIFKYKAYLILSMFQGLIFWSFGQTPLQKTISLQVNKQKLSNVLEIISNKGNFNFSYNSNIIKKDSLITLNLTEKKVKSILDLIFKTNFEFIESGNYIILRKKPISVSPIIAKEKPIITEEKNYYVTGYIIDEETKEKINKASVFEAKQLASDLTNGNGYFKLKLKSKYKTASLTVSKVMYKDTTISINPKLTQTIYIYVQKQEDTSAIVNVKPEDYLLPDVVEIESPNGEKFVYSKADSVKVQKNWIVKFLLSSKQKVQSLNLKKFFVSRGFQLSFVPGLSTQGKLSTQVSNKYSLNILGGYTAGAKIIEVGGLYNINNKNVQYFQAAGLFNIVGGSVNGFQAAGIQNLVYDSVSGLQAAGISNYIKGKFHGVQVAGIYNHVLDSVKGVQVAGIANFSKKVVNGIQVAGILNYAKKLNGIQIGLINIADTSNGYSIGLINIVKHGYSKISLNTNELTNYNIAYKSGHKKLYSILSLGANLNNNSKLFAYGYGIGRENKLSKSIKLATELTAQYIYAGDWDKYNVQNKLVLNFQWQPLKKLSIYAGPSFSLLFTDQQNVINGYQLPIPKNSIKTIDFSNHTKAWIGFTLGVNIL